MTRVTLAPGTLAPEGRRPFAFRLATTGGPDMLRDLIDKRARLYEQANGVLRKAGDEKREMTTEEVSQFDLLHEEMDKLGVTITRLERQATVEAELQRSTGRQADPGRPGAMVPARDD